MSQIADDFEFFWKGPFSQWHPSEFELDGIRFSTAEQAMMYAKALLFGDEATAAKILSALMPDKQKALGRQVRNFDEAVWDAHKEEIVRRANRAKFEQNKGLRRKLFQTGSKPIAEASPVDTIWGIGLSAEDALAFEPADWPGQNLLGRIVTEIREELRAQFPEEAAAHASNASDSPSIYA